MIIVFCVLTTIYFLSSVFPLQKNSGSNTNHLISPDSPSLPPNNLPPPLPIKSRDLIPEDSPPLNFPPPEDAPSDSPPPLSRSGTARVSFREPISSSYSVDEDEDEDENEVEPQGDEDNQQDGEQVEECFGSRLHLQEGIPPQMDLLGKNRLLQLYITTLKLGNEVNLAFSPVEKMDPLTDSAVFGEGGVATVLALTPLSTQSQRGSPDAHGRTGLGWNPWTGKGRKREKSGALPTPPHWPSSQASTNMRSPAQHAPHPQTQRKRVIS